MIVTAARRTIGFDRKIQLDWLDATADWVGQGLSVPDLRSQLEELLKGKVVGEGPHSARGKTITVLLHIWSLAPNGLAPLRDDGLALLQRRSGRKRLPLHWGMCVSTYPFFRDVAATTGRLLGLQGTVALSQVSRRMAEVWGDRSTVVRATQRVIRSFVLWKVLCETDQRGIFIAAPPIDVGRGDAAGPWLVEAGVYSSERGSVTLRDLLTSSTLFPFSLQVLQRDLARRSSLEFHRQGLDEDIVTKGVHRK